MYHPAKVREVIQGSDGTLLTVETWDRNTFTVDASSSLDTDDISPEDVVLLDYYPDSRFDVPAPKQVASHRLTGEQADRVWERYKRFYKDSSAQQTMFQQNPGFEGGYFG